MIIRIFIALLALNFVAFVVRADASEHPFGEDVEPVNAVQEIYRVQERMVGNFEDDSSEAVTEIGSRLLSLTFTRTRSDGKQYASDPAQPDHGIALLNEGACLNLKWNF